jgi:chloramphenicol 3-O-phosphotransferase
MVILLDGSSSMGRVTIAEKAVDEHESWRHLALEVLAEAAMPAEEESEAHLQVIKKCVEELAKDDLHLILTLPADSPHRDLLAMALQPDCITVHLGSADDGEYDFVIDPGVRSVNDVAKFLHTIMENDTGASEDEIEP